jgi:hypothetical protein
MAGRVSGEFDRLLLEVASEDFFADEGHPAHRVTVLAERGLKTRVVTTGRNYTQVLGHAIRQRLMQALKHTPGCLVPLTGAVDSEIIGRMIGKRCDVLVSTDLTRATDLIPHDLAAAVVAGLRESNKLHPGEIKVLSRLTGPQHLLYPDGSTVTSSRGLLMGLPTSWAVLSLIHLWWCDETRKASRWKRKDFFAHIMGDDALLATDRTGAKRYRSLVSACGGEPSYGKHFESDAEHEVRAVFLERLYGFGREDGRLISGYLCPAMPIKGVTGSTLPREFKGELPVRCGSRGIVQLIVLDALAERGGLDRPIANYIRLCVPWLRSYCVKALRLVPGHPLSIGGYRFAQRESGKDFLARLVLASGSNITTAVKRSVDPL